MRIAVAFSGGLDTSFLVPYLTEKYTAEIVTVTVNTGAFTEDDITQLEKRSQSLGAVDHFTIDAVQELYDNHLSHLIRGNVLKGGVYPLCVAAERTLQAAKVALKAAEVGARAVAHGSTGAGNDGVRFDVAFRVFAPQLEIIAPVRDEGWVRDKEVDFLEERGHTVEGGRQAISINESLWGTTLGGGWTHDSWSGPEKETYSAFDIGPDPEGSAEAVITFRAGLPVAVDGSACGGVSALRKLNELGRRYRLGREIHMGDTVLGIKGRIAFEAPGPLMILMAHRELEKLVLTGNQTAMKDMLASWYGKWVHEGLFFDPALRDVEAFFVSSQARVEGEARLLLSPGHFQVIGVRSPFSMIADDLARYGEENALWNGRDAKGFAALLSVPSRLHRQAGSKENR